MLHEKIEAVLATKALEDAPTEGRGRKAKRLGKIGQNELVLRESKIIDDFPLDLLKSLKREEFI